MLSFLPAESYNLLEKTNVPKGSIKISNIFKNSEINSANKKLNPLLHASAHTVNVPHVFFSALLCSPSSRTVSFPLPFSSSLMTAIMRHYHQLRQQMLRIFSFFSRFSISCFSVLRILTLIRIAILQQIGPSLPPISISLSLSALTFKVFPSPTDHIALHTSKAQYRKAWPLFRLLLIVTV